MDGPSGVEATTDLLKPRWATPPIGSVSAVERISPK